MPSGSHFFHAKGERFGPLVLCRLVMPSPVVLNQLTLMLRFKLKNSRIPTLPLVTACTWTSLHVPATPSLASRFCSWPTPTLGLTPCCFSHPHLWLSSSRTAHMWLLDCVVSGHSSKQPPDPVHIPAQPRGASAHQPLCPAAKAQGGFPIPRDLKPYKPGRGREPSTLSEENENRNRLTDLENKLMVTKGETWGEG